ncbi:MAG: exodeoxyribonuclease VII small subunit [Clostridia bacterium]|nr:exodeoxyribonuclease VII small subunit [Clostridia bacterium]
MTYEEASRRLEEVVEHLEHHELSLEEALRYFEEAVGLVNYCKKILTAAEHRLAVLVEEASGEFKLEPLSFSEDEQNEY